MRTNRISLFAGIVLALCISGYGGNAPNESYDDYVKQSVLAATAYEDSRWDDAIKHFSKVLEDKSLSESKRIGVEYYIARCYFHSNQVEKALDYLKSMEEKYSSSTAIDTETGQSIKTMALARIYSERARMLRSEKRFKEAIDAYQLSKKYWIALRDESNFLSEQQKELHKLGAQNASDLHIANCLERDGQTTEALSVYREIKKRFDIHKILGFSNKRFGDIPDQYYINVYINKKIGDCLNDKSYYQKALNSYPNIPSAELQNMVAKNHFIEKSDLESLAR